MGTIFLQRQEQAEVVWRTTRTAGVRSQNTLRFGASCYQNISVQKHRPQKYSSYQRPQRCSSSSLGFIGSWHPAYRCIQSFLWAHQHTYPPPLPECIPPPHISEELQSMQTKRRNFIPNRLQLWNISTQTAEASFLASGEHWNEGCWFCPPFLTV